MSSRAIRRHHRERLKKKRANYWGYPFRGSADNKETPMSEKALGKVVQTPSNCNCFMCRNPRKVFKGTEQKTFKERKDEQDMD